MAQNDQNPLFGALLGKDPDPRMEDALKKGLHSPKGILALLGELDYYLLIENLTRGPITEKQLISPYRWWLFFKGSAIASMVGTVLLLIRMGLLMSGETVDFRIKFTTFVIVYAFFILGTGNMFTKYLHYPDGATWLAVKYTLYGFTTGLIISETSKAILLCWTIYMKKYVGQYVYNQSEIIDFFLEIYYDLFVRSYAEELVTLLISYGVLVYFWMFVKKRELFRRDCIRKGKPYDLGMEN